ncbi:MAG: molybdopterin converting factor subunit 1 [Proteobacteria bacterium]|nr:molybdopterin converting factor subunit 1 [Burkholderiales bacterium]
MATVDLLYFARLREAFGIERERLALPGAVATTGDLRRFLAGRGETWARELDPTRVIRIAVNHDLAEADRPLADGDEVALFPPVTGG